jgi:hypothetical protein
VQAIPAGVDKLARRRVGAALRCRHNGLVGCARDREDGGDRYDDRNDSNEPDQPVRARLAHISLRIERLGHLATSSR